MSRVLLATTLSLAMASAHAATFNVTRFDDPVQDGCATNGCSLREALAAAAVAGTDTVVLPAGDYVVTEPLGTGAVTMEVADGTTLVGAGTASTVVRAKGVGSIFRVWGTVSFRRMAIEGADATGDGPVSTFGGAIRGYESKLTLEQVALRDNHASQGGGIYLQSSELVLRYATIEDNVSTHGGGGIQLVDTPATVSRTVIQRNAGSSGGGIRAQRSPIRMLADSVLRANTAQYNGGAVLSGDEFIADDDCVIEDNVASHGGAFADFEGRLVVRGVATLGGSGLLRIEGNRAEDPLGAFGGAFAVESGLTLERVDVVGNDASYGGGAIYAVNTDVVVNDSRFADNHAGYAGGMGYLFNTTVNLQRVALQRNLADSKAGALLLGGNRKMRLTNVDFYDNQAPASAAIVNGAPLSLSHVSFHNNLSSSGRDVVQQEAFGSTFYSNSLVLGRCTGTTSAISTAGSNLRSGESANACGGVLSLAPLMLSRGTFGGRFEVTGTTSSTSPLVNRGNSLYCTPLDVRGATRDPRCDIGAFEFGATP